MRNKHKHDFFQRMRSFFEEHQRKTPHSLSEGYFPGRRGHRWGRQAEAGEKLLSECRAGDQITIRRIVGFRPLRRRLLEMGMNPGTEVRIVKYAPLKDPLECELKGYHIALRVAEAQHIIVTPQKS